MAYESRGGNGVYKVGEVSRRFCVFQTVVVIIPPASWTLTLPHSGRLVTRVFRTEALKSVNSTSFYLKLGAGVNRGLV